MDLRKYLDDFYYDLLTDNYEDDYLEGIDEDNFLKVYNVFQKYGFYFINDIIIKYLEIFEMNPDYVEREILKLKDKLGITFVYLIGNDITYLNQIIENQVEE